MKKLFLLVLSMLMLLTGCIESLPIDQYSYVLNIGIDKGERLPYLVTLMVSTPSSQPSESGASGSFMVISAEGRNLFEAIETLGANQPNELNFARTSLIMFSRELAEENLITKSMDLALGKLRIRQNLRVAIAESDIKAVFEGFASSSDPSATKLKLKVSHSVNHTAKTVDTSWNHMRECFEYNTQDAMVTFCGVNQKEIRDDMVGGSVYPYIGGATLAEGELKTSIMGSAVFNGARMVGILDGQHTMLTLMARGEFDRGRIILQYQDGQQMSLTLSSNATPTIKLEEGNVSFTIKLEADIEMPEIMYGVSVQELERYIENYIANEMARVFMAVQRAEADVFCVGQQAIKKFSSIEEWERFDWESEYKELIASFTIIVKLNHSPDDIALE